MFKQPYERRESGEQSLLYNVTFINIIVYRSLCNNHNKIRRLTRKLMWCCVDRQLRVSQLAASPSRTIWQRSRRQHSRKRFFNW